MVLKLITWNINSIRARQDQVLDFVESEDPDFLCLQETKVVDQEFPEDELGDLGYDVAFYGQRSYNGVAIATREPAENIQLGFPGDDKKAEKRLVALDCDGLRVISVYAPNGHALGNDKYNYKLEWYKRMRTFLDQRYKATESIVVCGDFNICPQDIDAWHETSEPERLFLSPDERAAFASLTEFGLQDAYRKLHPNDKEYSWWDYRDAGFERNHGLRIDFFLISEPVAERLKTVRIAKEARSKEKASDHAPVVMELED